MLARVIWLTVGTSAVISSDSPAEKWKPCFPVVTCLLPCTTRQISGRKISCCRPLGAVARTVKRPGTGVGAIRSEEHTSELQSLMRISYAVFCLKKKKTNNKTTQKHYT